MFIHSFRLLRLVYPLAPVNVTSQIWTIGDFLSL